MATSSVTAWQSTLNTTSTTSTPSPTCYCTSSPLRTSSGLTRSTATISQLPSPWSSGMSPLLCPRYAGHYRVAGPSCAPGARHRRRWGVAQSLAQSNSAPGDGEGGDGVQKAEDRSGGAGGRGEEGGGQDRQSEGVPGEAEKGGSAKGEGVGVGSLGGGNEITDWRTFRAHLVAQSQAQQSSSGDPLSQEPGRGLEVFQERRSLENWVLLKSQNPALAEEVPWVHPTPGPEVGGILIASPVLNRSVDQRYWQVVVLVTRHDSTGSSGLILNRPSGYSLNKGMSTGDDRETGLSVFSGNAIYVGGYKSDGRTLHLIHGHPLTGAEELSPGIFRGGLEGAAERVLHGDFPATDFRFFVGHVEWLPGKLEDELRKGAWFTAACARALVLKQALQLPKPLWREVLELMGGEYAQTAKREYGEIP